MLSIRQGTAVLTSLAGFAYNGQMSVILFAHVVAVACPRRLLQNARWGQPQSTLRQAVCNNVGVVIFI